MNINNRLNTLKTTKQMNQLFRDEKSIKVNHKLNGENLVLKYFWDSYVTY